MSVSIITLADAVVTTLNAAVALSTYSQTFTATRAYVPISDLASLATLTVTVVPRAIVQTNRDRTDVDEVQTVQVAVQKKLTALTTAVIDPYMTLIKEIAADLLSKRLTITDEAVLLGVQNDPIYDVNQLEQQKCFFSLLTLAFKSR